MTVTLMTKRLVLMSQQLVHLLSNKLLPQALLSRKLQPMAHSLQLCRQLQVKLHQALGLGVPPCRSSPLLLLVLVRERQGMGGAAEGEGPKGGKGGEEAGQSSIHHVSCPGPFQIFQACFWPS